MKMLLHAHTDIPDLSVIGFLKDVLLESLIETISVLPFLFLTYLFMEFLEHKAQDKIKHLFTKAGIMGPLVATLCGCIPQCGFSVMSANLYSSGIITYRIGILSYVKFAENLQS